MFNFSATRNEQHAALGIAMGLVFVIICMILTFTPAQKIIHIRLRLPTVGVSMMPGAGRLYSEDDLRWLARNIYFESRGEPTAGQLAVAYVTMHRVDSNKFPDSVYRVVNQQHPNCQFSWTCDGKNHNVLDRTAWNKSIFIAASVLQERYQDPVPDILFFHAPSDMSKVDEHRYIVINNHVFLRSPRI